MFFNIFTQTAAFAPPTRARACAASRDLTISRGTRIAACARTLIIIIVTVRSVLGYRCFKFCFITFVVNARYDIFIPTESTTLLSSSKFGRKRALVERGNDYQPTRREFARSHDHFP